MKINLMVHTMGIPAEKHVRRLDILLKRLCGALDSLKLFFPKAKAKW
jgi:hypothetical protein